MEATERSRFTRVDLLAVLGFAALSTLMVPYLSQRSRESARRAQCANNLRQIGVGLQSYVSAHLSLPYAARWGADNLEIDRVYLEPLTGHATYDNWAQLILPHLGEGKLADMFDLSLPATSPENAQARNTALAMMRCAADRYNRPEKPYSYEDPKRSISASFARGNYAINGGSNDANKYPGSSSAPSAGGYHYSFDSKSREFSWWGNGVAGINKAFSPKDFQNGTSTLVAVNEVRAGIHPVDPRGVWALGQIAGSITFAHGITGDDFGPNNQGERADDIVGCGQLYEILGPDVLKREHMPCCSYWPNSHQATSRSLHAGGVNALMMDGAVRYIEDSVDPGVWHAIHSREFPPDLIKKGERATVSSASKAPEPKAQVSSSSKEPRSSGGEHQPQVVVNSIGLELASIPSGEFTMGVPDVGFEKDVPPECPPHRVRIGRPFFLGVCEVTQEQYKKVMGANPSWHTTASGLKDLPPQSTAHLPVEQVSWEQAVEFCRRLSELPAERAAGITYRLPTEAEWEFACRSGRSEAHPWSGTADLKTGENAGEHRTGSLDVVAVGSYPANEFGLRDMRGNVYEWCADWFSRDYYRRSPREDPQGPDSGFLRVVRGGDWLFVGEMCMINRRVTAPWQSCSYLGFRVAATTRDSGEWPLKDTKPNPSSPPLAVVSSHRNPRQMELLKLDPSRGTASLLKSGWLHAPSWSHDGQWIVFAENKKEINIIGVDGPQSQARNLTRGGFRFATAPTWSSDDKRVAFFGSQTNVEQDRRVFIVDADGKNLHPLLPSKGMQLFPAWSPDGRLILFEQEREREPGVFDLVVADPSGGNLRTVRPNVPYLAAPAWAPSGDRFVFADFGKAPGQLRLRVAKLSDGALVAEVTDGNGLDLFPAWSPEGNKIAYAHFEGEKDSRGDLMLFDIDQKGTTTISEGTLMMVEESRPSWAPKALPDDRRLASQP